MAKRNQSAFDDYPDEFLDCRTINHPWGKQGGYFVVGREVHRKLVCPRCDTMALDRWKRNGERIGRQYFYSAGYLLKDVVATKWDARVETLRRVTVFASEQDMIDALTTNGRRRG